MLVLQFDTPMVRRNTSIIEPLDKFAARLADNLHVADVHDDDYDEVNAVDSWWFFYEHKFIICVCRRR
jgi:hypothetical protein